MVKRSSFASKVFFCQSLMLFTGTLNYLKQKLFPLIILCTSKSKEKVKIFLLQAVKVPRFARGRGSHVT
jgi:hypothetical protein